MSYFTYHEGKGSRRHKVEVSLRNYHSRVKSGLLADAARQHPGASLLDLGAGRGADCARYAQFRCVTAVDQDAEALAELRRRAAVIGQEVDIRQGNMLDYRGGRQADVISTMFCAHYACGTDQSQQALAATVSENLKAGGHYVGLSMDGDSVLRELGNVRQKSYVGWAHISLTDGSPPCLNVTINSISPTPKREPLLMWPSFRAAMEASGLRLVCEGMLNPGTAIANAQLAAFSKLHRWWAFVKD